MVDTCFYFFHVRKNRTKTPQKAQKAHPGFEKSSEIPWGFVRQISEAKVGEAVPGDPEETRKTENENESKHRNEYETNLESKRPKKQKFQKEYERWKKSKGKVGKVTKVTKVGNVTKK